MGGRSIGFKSRILEERRSFHSGKKYNYLLVKDVIRHHKHDYYVAVCLCDCGTDKEIPLKCVIRNITKSCGCIIKKHLYIRGSTILRDRYKKKCEYRGLKFELELSEFEYLISQPCYYCGIKDSCQLNRRHVIVKYNGIDRIDNSKGYNYDNCITCCVHCNVAKSTMTLNEFKSWIKRVYNHTFFSKESN